MIIKNGSQIIDLEDWCRRAGPKSSIQWKDGRSAKECAKEWLGANGKIPNKITKIVESHSDFGPILNWSAEPESAVRIDDFRGEPPNIDVLLRGNDAIGSFVIVIEAKADEPFGDKLEKTSAKARKRLEASPTSKGLDRIARLTQSIFGLSSDNDQLSHLRYQLFTATGAALAEAERQQADRAIVLVHEFATDQTELGKRENNNKDLQSFLSLLAGYSVQVDQGHLIGPISIPGSPITNHTVQVYFGKVVTTPNYDST